MFLVTVQVLFFPVSNCNSETLNSLNHSALERYTRRHRFRSLQCNRLEVPVRSPPSFVANCNYVCQTLKGLPVVVLLPEIVHLRTVYFAAKYVFIIIRPHRSATYMDAAYCYRPSSVVCRSVCLSH